MSKLILETNPDLIITYDLSGLYGHNDHIVVSEIVTEIAKANKTELWYTTLPKKMLDRINLPEHMSTDNNFKLRRSLPNIKILTASHTLNKIRAVYTYKSQHNSFQEGLPTKIIPMWFFHSLPLYEYFYRVEN